MPTRKKAGNVLPARTERPTLAEEQVRFARELRKGGSPGPLLFLLLASVGWFGGCYAGSVVSEHLGTVGDMAGGLVTLGRMTLGSLLGVAAASIAFVLLRKSRSRTSSQTR